MPSISDDATRLLDHLGRGGAWQYLWLLSESRQEGEALVKRTIWYGVGDDIPAPDDHDPVAGPLHIYFGVHPVAAIPSVRHHKDRSYKPDPDKVRPLVSEVSAINALIAEFDVKTHGDMGTLEQAIDLLDPAPSVVIFSGGGAHCYWLLDKPLLITDESVRARAMAVQAAWVRLVNSEPESKDLARVLRLPGTKNYKAAYGEDHPTVQFLHADFSRTYTFALLEELAQPFLASNRPERVERPKGQYSLADDLLRAGENLRRLARWRCDDYNAWLAVGMALTPLGTAGLALWDDWSRPSEKYEDGACDEKWPSFTTDAHGLAKLGAWANEDDPPLTIPLPVRPAIARGAVVMPLQESEDATDEPAAPAQPPTVAPGGLIVPLPYRFKDGVVRRLSGKKDTEGDPIYNGVLSVSSIGTDVTNQKQTLRVWWRNELANEQGEVVSPKQKVATKTGLLDEIAGHSAAIHDGNAAACAAYLIELVNANAHVLPRELVTQRYGYVDNETFPHRLILPAGVVGQDEPVHYTGRSPVKIGTDPDVYPAAIRELMTWPGNETATLMLGMSLAAPAIARLRPPRNPVVYLGGSSNIGKTSLSWFCLGLFGPPNRRPFQVQAPGMTKVGAQQAITQVSGLPILFDETHMANLDVMEPFVYSFANAESRTIGSMDGQGRGGEEIHGTMLLAGESILRFVNAGTANRIIFIEGNLLPPLGANTIGLAESDEYNEGQRRSDLLRNAATTGAGLFGKTFSDELWNRWDSFVVSVQQVEAQHPLLRQVGAWGRTLAIGFAALALACDLAGATPPDPAVLDEWTGLLLAGRQENDPAAAAFEKLVALYQAAAIDDSRTSTQWEILSINHQPVFYRFSQGQGRWEDFWRVPTSSKPFEEYVGDATVRLHGKTWARKTWIRPGPDGRSTKPMAVDGATQRCLLVPEKMLRQWIASDATD